MVLSRKFSTSIAFFLVVFMGASLVLIASIVYFMRSSKVREESFLQFEGRKLELAKILKENLENLQDEAGTLVSDPLFLQYMHGGDSASLSRYIASFEVTINGAYIIVYNSRTGKFIPKPSETLEGIDPYLSRETQPDPQNIKFNQLGTDTVTLFSLPVLEADSEIGTCFLIYNFTEDSRFQEIVHSMGMQGPHILFHAGGEELYDVETGRRVSLEKEIAEGDDPEKRTPLPTNLLPGETILPLDYFPGMYFGASTQPFMAANKSLLKVLASLCIAIFGLVCIASALLSKMIVKPLEVLAAEAVETSLAPTDRFLREEKTGYVEFRQIARAFNQVLANLMELQQKYKIKAKKELDASEERYRLTLEAAPDCITINSLVDGRFIQINEAFVRISGYSREEILGKSNEDLNLFPDPSELDRLIEEAIQKGAVNGVEVKHRRKDGVVIDSVVSARVVDFEEEPCLISVASDRTAQKKAEEEQKKLESALQRASKMEAIGTMAGGVAHDLNNILSGIVSYPELLLMDLPEDSPLRPAVLTIQKSGQKAAAIVQDMLTLARRGVSVTEVVNINDVIREYLKSPEHQSLLTLSPDIRMQVELGKDVMNLIGSDVHIAKSLMNLVSNAIEAMSDGGDLRISTRNQYVDRPIRRYDTVKEGDYVILEVSDTGTGISRDGQERIFEPFYTKKKMGRSGTGLGMAVVWGTVKDHNGYIDLESRPGVGTTFQLYFPATRNTFIKDKPQILEDEYRGDGESVLVVDDVAEQRRIATTILKRLGYQVASVASGEEALEYLREKAVDLLVLDMVMEPGMDGLETYRKILERFPGQRAVIASGFAETDRVREAQRLGVGPYVRKPYLMQNIGIAVRKELDRA